MTESEQDEQIVRAFVDRAQRRIQRIATWSGAVVLLLFFGGFAAALAIDLRLLLLMVLGGVGLVPAAYLSRRAALMTARDAPLRLLVASPGTIQRVELVEQTFRNRDVEVCLEVATKSAVARVPIAVVPVGVAVPEATRLLAAVRRRANLPVDHA